MVRARFWSTFAREHFDDAALEAGIAVIRRDAAARAAADGDGEASAETMVRFEERLVFITATNPGDGIQG